MTKVFIAIGLLCLAGCTAVEKYVPKTPQEAAIAAVDAYDKADKAAMLACMAYKQGVYAGVIKPTAKADAKCDSLVDEDEPDHTTDPDEPSDKEKPIITPTNFFPGNRMVPA